MNSIFKKEEWFSNIRADILAGMTVALALIPEAIAFSIIAGVDPMVGLYASFCIAVIIAFTGGRPAMISAATGAMALLMVTLVKDHGVEYLFATTVLTGIIQYIMGVFKLGRFISFLPQSVIIGFVNALAILIFLAQLPHFENAGFIMYLMVAGTIFIMVALPKITTVIPSALAAIIVMTAVSIFFGLDLKTVGDMGEITRSLPSFHIPSIELSLETLAIIFPYAITLAIVGQLESLLTATIVDDMTDTKSDKNKEMKGQGIANIVTGFFGGMAGCAMIGQTVINVNSGGRGRLSTLTSGVFLLFLIIVLGDIVKQIPMAALVGVMIMVSIGTFDWGSLKEIRKIPLADSMVMMLTIAIVVYTHDLSKGVIAGVIASALVFGWKVADIKANVLVEGNKKIYKISGQMFFGTVSHFIDKFHFNEDPDHIVIDFSNSHVWDHSAVTGISKVILKYQQIGKTVEIIGLNEESKQLIEKVGLSSRSGH